MSSFYLGDARALHLRIEGQLQLGPARLLAETSQVLAERKRDGVGERAARGAGLVVPRPGWVPRQPGVASRGVVAPGMGQPGAGAGPDSLTCARPAGG